MIFHYSMKTSRTILLVFFKRLFLRKIQIINRNLKIPDQYSIPKTTGRIFQHNNIDDFFILIV